jgi:hypothetical protein
MSDAACRKVPDFEGAFSKTRARVRRQFGNTLPFVTRARASDGVKSEEAKSRTKEREILVERDGYTWCDQQAGCSESYSSFILYPLCWINY